ncbi:sulfatase-like protein [Phytophthora cinnamomi]|uniref:sulfatase-like protein n=1 Tax=Phytophthora cinnamomi TaxID=4785 RepID=UPI00355A982E|nr:sulfatase-like protein [Phytophthora cinnamomi]
MMAPFAADLLLVINRDMRFSLDLVATLIRERHHLKAAPISTEEIHRGYVTAALVASAATIFALVRTWDRWANLAYWNPTHIVVDPASAWGRSVKLTTGMATTYQEVALEEGAASPKSPNTFEDKVLDKLSSSNANSTYRTLITNHTIQVAVVLMGLVVVPALVVAVRCEFSPLVAYSALNATLNELFGHALQPAPADATFTNVNINTNWLEMYIHPTERHKLFGDDSLYRLTTGFRGDLAFDVSVSSENPPNVLVISVESFRYRDSRYMVGEDDPSNLFKDTDLTITPNFDRWAKRGVALRNLWTSVPTSRSLESVQFAQLPYDSATKTAITGGREDTELAGLPQLFSAKGYETFFSTGSSIDLDNWDIFLPSHGFETVWDNKKMIELAEANYNISNEDWSGEEHRGFNWGVHDDVSFQILGDLLVNKTNNQTEQMANGEPKKPLFITHYTITSHAPFESWPTWYDKSEKPDFSAFYEGHERAKEIQRYLEARYFTDLELGKFLDRMADEGVLKDTIVVIMGDHGTAPEVEVIYTEEESMTRVPGVIIAEGRLGKSAGLVIEDAAEHYDILNTLADITGVPEGGFQQNGVGRSLKRKVTFGERAVFSNVPGRKMSVVRGRQRLRYDSVTDAVLLHDTETDYNMAEDLLPGLSPEKQAEWLAWRDNGRRISAYYTKRWDENCLLAVNCTQIS